MTYYPAVTRVQCGCIRGESPNAWLVLIGDGEYWIPRSVARVVHYENAIFDVESWFAHQCLRGARPVTRRRDAMPLDALAEELRFPPARVQVSQHASREPQREAFMKLRNSRVFALLMKCRTGKTKPAIDLACQHVFAGRVHQVLWLCPVSVIPTARWQWSRFAQAPSLIEPETLRVFGLETLSSCGQDRYDALVAWVKRAPTLCVIDESHMVKTVSAKRSKRTERLAQLCAVRGIMSGSPITRDIRDLFWPFYILDWRILGYRNLYQFEQRHVEYSTKIPGLVCRTKDEDFITTRVLPFTYEYFPPDCAADEHASTAVWMSDEQRHWYERVKSVVIARISDYDARSYDVYLLFTALASVLSGHISLPLLRRLDVDANAPLRLPSPKIGALAHLRADIDERMIVWCTRRHEIAEIAAALPEPYVVTGDVSPADRHAIIQQFRQSACGTLVAMVQVAKRGIDIYEADTAIFYGQSFDYESREQAAARIQAPGIKTAPCRYVDLVYRDSLDERIMKSHDRKENIIRSFLRLLRDDRTNALAEMRRL